MMKRKKHPQTEFNVEEAKSFLEAREEAQQEQSDQIRKTVLERIISVLKQEFQGSKVEVYLIGSILRPFQFTSRSDIDVVVKNYQGDRFDLGPKLEAKMGRCVEIILFETCHFQEFVLKQGLRVI